MTLQSAHMGDRGGVHTTFRTAKSWKSHTDFLIAGLMETGKGDFAGHRATTRDRRRPNILGELQWLFPVHHGDYRCRGAVLPHIERQPGCRSGETAGSACWPGIETKGTISPAVCRLLPACWEQSVTARPRQNEECQSANDQPALFSCNFGGMLLRRRWIPFVFAAVAMKRGGDGSLCSFSGANEPVANGVGEFR